MWHIDHFPPSEDLETKAVLRQCAVAHRYLAELKGACQSIPNEAILINTLSLQEAKDSSAIENIVTTHDDLFKENLDPERVKSLAAKEVHDYAIALRKGFDMVAEHRLITSSYIRAIQEVIENNQAGFRKVPGTTLKNDATGEVVYTPPQHPDDVVTLMTTLERFANDEALELDPLIRMALLHHQFESIHPFHDGNGRTGRILNVLYLVRHGLLDIPVLYLSRHLIQTKGDYYRLLQSVRDDGAWEPWILYMLTAVEKTAQFTLQQVDAIKASLADYKHRIRHQFPKIYSQDLINNLFNHPYTKIEFVERDLGVSRLTATSYLTKLTDAGFLAKHKLGRSNYYINLSLFPILTREGL